MNTPARACTDKNMIAKRAPHALNDASVRLREGATGTPRYKNGATVTGGRDCPAGIVWAVAGGSAVVDFGSVGSYAVLMIVAESDLLFERDTKMSLCCRNHLLCLGLGADCAPPIELEVFFNGELSRTIPVSNTSPEAIHEALDSAPMGNGWGVRIKSTADILDLIGACDTVSGWVFEVPFGMMFACEVSQ